jgi:hypothetical protein
VIQSVEPACEVDSTEAVSVGVRFTTAVLFAGMGNEVNEEVVKASRIPIAIIVVGSKIRKYFLIMGNATKVYHSDIRHNFLPFISYLCTCNYFCSIIARMFFGYGPILERWASFHIPFIKFTPVILEDMGFSFSHSNNLKLL